MEYVVAASDYYSQGTPDPNSFAGANFAAMVERPIKQLIERYRLAGKSILSLGAGAAFEEYWMHQAGCRLTLNDLDAAQGTIKPFLVSLPRHDGSGAIRYFLEDAAETVRNVEPHDVLYVSSFHPDEIRREEIMLKHGRWPEVASPYLPLLMDALRTVKPGGFAIFQHYRGGVDPAYNPHYISLVQNALRTRGITLLDVYAYRTAPTKMLIAGCRGEIPDLGPDITEFHGRYPYAWIRRDVIKLYDHRTGSSQLAPPGTIEKIRRKLINTAHRFF